MFLERSVHSLLDGVCGQRVVAGDRDRVTVQGAALSPGRPSAGDTKILQCGQKDLPVGGRHQVVEDGVDGRAHVKQDIGQHEEVVVEVVQVIGPVGDVAKHEAPCMIGQPAHHKGDHHHSYGHEKITTTDQKIH